MTHTPSLGTVLLDKLAAAVHAVRDWLCAPVTFGTALLDQLAVAVRAVQDRLWLEPDLGQS